MRVVTGISLEEFMQFIIILCSQQIFGNAFIHFFCCINCYAYCSIRYSILLTKFESSNEILVTNLISDTRLGEDGFNLYSIFFSSFSIGLA